MNTLPTSGKGIVLLDSFTMTTAERWRIVNDGVMGGLSSSAAIVNQEGTIAFSGNISLRNNGGFASLRSRVDDYDFKKYFGLEIRIKGDGKRYSISMKETVHFTGYFYTVTFQTQ